MTIVYYRGPSAHVTQDVLEVWCPDYRTFNIGDLDSIWVVSRARHRLLLFPLPVAAVLLAVLLPAVGAPLWLLVVAALVAVGFVALAVYLRIPAPPYELHALHNGAPVRLLRCSDARVFGQIQRALMRAIQVNSDW